MTFLVLQSVTKRYGRVTALDEVGLGVEPGTRTAIVGASGSGKTTLLRMVAGFEAPDAGRITLGGDLLAHGPAAMPAHRRGVGVVAQDGALFPHLSVADNIGFGLPRHGDRRAGRIADLMRLVELDPALAARRPDQLSGGQQQRVALARAMARQPRLMLLDEPFSALDTALRASTRKAVSDVLRQAGITAVLVTHDQAEALSFADQVAVMRGGRLVQVGTPRALYARPVDQGVATFLGEALILPAQVDAGIARCALGAVPVDPARPAGPATIMLRPEQLSLHPAANPGEAGTGEVLEADFAGAMCTYAIRLLAPGLDAPLLLRQPSMTAFEPGSLVRISVNGPAHLFLPSPPEPGPAPP